MGNPILLMVFYWENHRNFIGKHIGNPTFNGVLMGKITGKS